MHMDRIPRRGWLVAMAALASSPAAAESRRRRRPPAKPQAAAAAPPPPPPAIDGPPPPSRIPGLEPAPVPRTGLVQGPLSDREPKPRLSFGLPTASELPQGQTFTRADPTPDRRAPSGGGNWLPSPGAMLRVPF